MALRCRPYHSNRHRALRPSDPGEDIPRPAQYCIRRRRRRDLHLGDALTTLESQRCQGTYLSTQPIAWLTTYAGAEKKNGSKPSGQRGETTMNLAKRNFFMSHHR